ncbi:restriction endonuclease [Gorillibacterium sp. sgz5001074]|uniref:restriction endonuclease n=1 Tax=Gorillibacterium sp. sgz5001074 TaxID=3446695 RepID=UPI003F67FA35
MEHLQDFYTENFENFNEWFELIRKGDFVYPQLRIPYEEWLEEYIELINTKTISEVKELLRCLLVPVHRNTDVEYFKLYQNLKSSDQMLNPKLQELLSGMDSNEMYKRIGNGNDAWEGVTWILELLPYSPYQAVISLEGYAYSQPNLPDDRIIGISQCVKIIYARFIHLDKPKRNLLNLQPVEFEWLIEYLYSRMGYKTQWTSMTRDGGKDIIASITRADGEERVYIECKLYNTTELSNQHVKTFAYTVNDDKINRGVIFCTGYANNALKNIDQRITIINYEGINVLLNSHLGSDWDERLDKIIKFQRNKFKS